MHKTQLSFFLFQLFYCISSKSNNGVKYKLPISKGGTSSSSNILSWQTKEHCPGSSFKTPIGVLTTLHTLKGGRFLLKEKVEALTTFLICPYASHSGRIGYENLLYFGENCCFLTGSSRALFLDV